MKDELQFASALVGLAAAGLWFIATLVRVKPQARQSEPGWENAQIIFEGKDVIETARLQGRWNTAAALVTGIAAALQSWSYFV
jgi:hypothetical protein